MLAPTSALRLPRASATPVSAGQSGPHESSDLGSPQSYGNALHSPQDTDKTRTAVLGAGPALRPYQAEALEAIREAWAGGCRRQLVSMATGTGKTCLFSSLPEIGFRRLLVLAHREELLDQAADKLRTWNPGLRVQVDQADRVADLEEALFDDETAGHAVCASVATVGRAGSRRLTRYPEGAFDALVVDEAHHSTAASYRTILRHFRAGEPGGPLLLGVTATPFRADGADLSKVFDRIVFEFDLPRAIDAGFLADVRAVAVQTNTNLDKVRATREDFVAGELEDAVNTPARNARVVKAYLERATGRKAIVFAAGIEHSKALADAFVAEGVRAEHLDGGTPGEERAAILGRLRSGETAVVCNVGVLTEGFDEPSVSAIVLARPTKSGVLYAQCIGRGTRLHEGKPDLLVIDLVDNTSRHSLVCAAVLFGLPATMDLGGLPARAVRKKVDELVQEGIPFDELAKARAVDLDQVANRYREIRLFWQPKPASEVSGLSSLTWVSIGRNDLSLRAGELTARIRVDLLGHAHLSVTRRQPKSELLGYLPDLVEVSEELPSIEAAIRRADAAIIASAPRAFVDPQARWRRQPASEKQLALLAKFRVPHADGITKGEAGILLDKAFARRAAARRPWA